MYEGAPNWPDEGRFWKIIEDYQVSILYTAPTAIRAFMKWGEQFPRRHDLSSLRLLGTVGEPINPEAWMWYYRVIGGGRCPVVDTWWQTETGAIMISPLPGAIPAVPGSATRPLPGIVPDIVTRDGRSCAANQGGFLVIKQPWPSMLRTLYGDDERYKAQYWSDIPGCYFTGDGARRDENGNYWVLGRVDDVINVAGHRLSTMEVESALVEPSPGRRGRRRGQARRTEGPGNRRVRHARIRQRAQRARCEQELRAHVAKEIGALARPDEIRFTDSLPKTRSGKIMRQAAARHRRRRRQHRRHHDARGPERAGAAAPARIRMRSDRRSA